MIDLLRLTLPSVEDAHGKKWLCVYNVATNESGTFYLAVEATGNQSMPLPQPCFLIMVPPKKSVPE